MKTTLQYCYENFLNVAKTIPNFKEGAKNDVPYDINYLCDSYVYAQDHQDKDGMEKYLSALFVRYWYMIPYMYEDSKSLNIEMVDIIPWLYDAFTKAFEYRSWQDSSKDVSKDPKGAEKVINQCLTSVRGYWYQHFNKDRRKANYQISTYLDELIDDSKGHLSPMHEVVGEEDEVLSDVAHSLVQDYMNKNKILEAIIIDAIAYQHSFNESANTFSLRLLVDNIAQYNSSSRAYFLSKYLVDGAKLTSTLDEIKGYSRYKLKKHVSKILEDLKRDKGFLSCLEA